MTASLQIAKELSRRLRGGCLIVSGGVLANDGQSHKDCSTCHAQCGGQIDLGVPEAGFTLERDWAGLKLAWRCSSCGCEVTERTSIFAASSHARLLALDDLCHRCRLNPIKPHQTEGEA